MHMHTTHMHTQRRVHLLISIKGNVSVGETFPRKEMRWDFLL
jgi:hypothetical protein